MEKHFKKIETCISSCDSATQEEAMVNMIENFRSRWKNQEKVSQLYKKLHEKFDKYHSDSDSNSK